MKRSVDRILTTHTGSLPRPAKLVELMFAKEEGRQVDEQVLGACIRDSVREVLEHQCAVANAMKPEYEAIVRAGFLLQLDCPDLAMTRHREFADKPLEAFREYIRLHIEVLNAAVAGIPADRMRAKLW